MGEEERKWVEFDAEVLETAMRFVREGCEDNFERDDEIWEVYGAWCVDKGILPR